MSLQKILLDIGAELGIDLTNDNELTWCISKINDVAKELYESQDIVGCLREQTFNIDYDPSYSSLVSLPFYVDQLRGIRYSNITGGKISMNDMRPRYHSGRGWGANAFGVNFRIVRENAPIKRDIVNASILKFSVEKEMCDDVTINIVGKTTNSDRAQETVVLEAGSLEVETVCNYEDIESIEKTATCDNNIFVTDIEDNELAIIPNHELTTLYKWLEIQDANAGIQVFPTSLNSAIDILFKLRFSPFVNQYDEFPCGNKCDRAIFFKFVEYYEASKLGREGRALAAKAKAEELIKNINTDSEAAKVMDIQFGRNGLLDAQQPFIFYKRPYYGSGAY